MAAFGAGDMATFFGDFGVEVIFGVYRCKGNLSRAGANDDFGQQAEINVDASTLMYPLAALPGLKVRSAITVDGTAYIVTDASPLDDGQLGQVELRLA